MTETRTVSSTGGAKGVKPARFDLIPTDSLWELAEHYGNGFSKYGDAGQLDNWRRGYEWSKSFAAAYRHLTLAMSGEEIDEETGSKHVIAVAWHMFALAHWMNDPFNEFDDRQSSLEALRQTQREMKEVEFWDQMYGDSGDAGGVVDYQPRHVGHFAPSQSYADHIENQTG